jgi:hypothetical protein
MSRYTAVSSRMNRQNSEKKLLKITVNKMMVKQIAKIVVHRLEQMLVKLVLEKKSLMIGPMHITKTVIGIIMMQIQMVNFYVNRVIKKLMA